MTKDRLESEEEVRESLGLLEQFPIPSLDQWRKVVEADLKGADFDKKLLWRSPEGFTVKPLYTREDIKNLGGLEALPGEAPFRRGNRYPVPQPSVWQVRQDCQAATPEEVNTFLRDGLARGLTAVAIRLDNAARRGFDADDPRSRELAGRAGCTLTSLNGLRVALSDIDLARVPVTLRCGTSSVAMLAALMALADERRVSRSLLTGAVECDPLRELCKGGELRCSLDGAYNEMAANVLFAADECPGIRTVMVNSHHFHNASATIARELAYTLASGVEYLRALSLRGVPMEVAARSMVFSFSVASSLFMEIAKLRAARTLWCQITSALGIKDEEAQRMFLHVRTSSRTLSTLDPWGNMIRGTIQAFAAAVGGCDSMDVTPFDASNGRPDDFSMRIARNQQLLLQEEAGLSHVTDPGGGSYLVETLTDSIAREAWKLFQEIEAAGGLVAALKSGLVQRSIAKDRESVEGLVARRRTSLVGVNVYANPKEKPLPKSHIPRDQFLAERRRRIHRLKAMRRNSAVRSMLAEMTQRHRAGQNREIVDVAIEAMRTGATLGEVTLALSAGRPVQGLVVEKLGGKRLAQPYEHLRARTNAWAAAHSGSVPRVALVPMGVPAMRRARAEFTSGFVAAAGLIAEPTATCQTAEEAVKAIMQSGALVAVLCADDPTYPTVAEAIVKGVTAANGPLVYIAGYPQDTLDQLKAAGVDGFVHLGANVLEVLGQMQDLLGFPTLNNDSAQQ